MSKIFTININSNNIGFEIQTYENNVKIGNNVNFPSKACLNIDWREFLYDELQRKNEYVLSNEEKQQINEQLNNIDSTKLLT
jgi:hypothetical protein